MKTLKWLGNLFKGNGEQYDYAISLSDRVQYSDEPKKFFHLFEQALINNAKGKRIKVDLTGATFIYPEALLFLICLRESVEGTVDIHFENGSQPHEYLDHAGFCEQFNINKFPLDQEKTLVGKVFELRKMQGSVNGHQMATELVDLLKSEQDIGPSVEQEIIESIEEVLGNILQHSGCSQYFLLGQAYPTSNRIRFVFYDNGVGIKNHIIAGGYNSKHPNFKTQVSQNTFNDIENSPSNLAIEAASRDFVSATDYTQNSGAGINFLIETLLPVSEGKLSILSENGIVAWRNGRKISCNMKIPYKLRGTLVSLTLNCEPGTTIV